MTISELEAIVRARLTRRRCGRLTDPTHSRVVSIPANRATALRLEALAIEMSERLGYEVGARQIAALLLVVALAEMEPTDGERAAKQ